MMRRKLKLIGERPTGKRVRKTVELPDGRQVVHEVFVADPSVNRFADNKAAPIAATDFFAGDGCGWVRCRSNM